MTVIVAKTSFKLVGGLAGGEQPHKMLKVDGFEREEGRSWGAFWGFCLNDG